MSSFDNLPVRAPRSIGAAEARVMAAELRDYWERFESFNPFHATRASIRIMHRHNGVYSVGICYSDPNSGGSVPVCLTWSTRAS